MIRATDDVERLRTFIAQGLVLATSSLLLLGGALLVLALTNLQLTLVVLPLLPIALVLFMLFGALSQPLFMTLQARLSQLNNILQENLAGLKVVKAFARETYEEQRFDIAATDLMEQQLKVSRIFSFLFPVVFLVAQLGQAAILYFGGVQILAGTLDLGAYQQFSLYLIYIFFPLGQLGFIISLMAQAAASAKRIFEVLDAESEIRDRPDALPLPPMIGKVEFRNDAGGNVHAVVGKLSFEQNSLAENIQAFVDHINGLKPATVKGTYVRGIWICATMSPSVPVAA